MLTFYAGFINYLSLKFGVMREIKVVVTDPFPEGPLNRLREYFPVFFVPDISADELTRHFSDTSIIVCRGRIKMDASFLEKMPGLRIVARPGSGLEFIDIPFALSRGILPLNSASAFAVPVAEHAITLLLTLLKKILFYHKATTKSKWPRTATTTRLLRNLTCGIMGYGNTGKETCCLLMAMGAKVLIWDPYVVDYSLSHLFCSSMEMFLGSSSVIFLHVPLTKETFHMVNRDFLARCRKGVIIINTSRGEIVNTAHLIEALQAGVVGGYGADVIEGESSDFNSLTEEGTHLLHALTRFDNVIITPHVAARCHEAQQSAAEIIVEKILKYTPLVFGFKV